MLVQRCLLRSLPRLTPQVALVHLLSCATTLVRSVVLSPLKEWLIFVQLFRGVARQDFQIAWHSFHVHFRRAKVRRSVAIFDAIKRHFLCSQDLLKLLSCRLSYCSVALLCTGLGLEHQSLILLFVGIIRDSWQIFLFLSRRLFSFFIMLSALKL